MATTKWEELRDASFRGVPFYFVDVEGTGGRRAIPHAYPKKEVGWTEDHGAVLTQEQINAKLLGSDYQTQLNRLLAALNTPGPGELVHPWFGVQKVQIGKVTHKLSTEEGGIAYVSFEVFEAGEQLFPSQQEDTQATTLSAADTVKEALASGDYFAALDGVGNMVDTLLDDLQGFVTNLPTLPAALNEWMDRLNRFKDLAGIVAATPGELIRDVTGLISDMQDLVSEAPWALRVYDQLRDKWEGDRAAQAATKSLADNIAVNVDTGFASSVTSSSTIEISDDMQANIDDFQRLVIVSALVAKAETVASATFETSQEAQGTGDELAERLGEQAIDAVESGQRSLWRSLRDLRFAVVNDVRIRSVQLPELRRVSPRQTTPVMLMAWRETGDAEQRDAMVTRNRLRYPAFILPTQTIEVVDSD
ncbi:multidrug DMT transporter [Serratia marcescens]|uniref:DNA circularization N-terminal domain-containing protein n=1 Tax=Serratia marcescens TaxID=615 RepID=A0ABD5BI37_SERMA|nr:DNA circularization N-terminal domain-containing protein [Serratia marcescens]MCZ6928675.1 multidrug DMT transporter [Serratia marcescens]MDE5234328.1 DNA circularization N-terminal domain-containing protein [Serratia marcescens]MDE5257505.1 DNA circularization N-terminal domain-containing protein [Serratia marcescens]MDQ9402283.1 DNA circularization N-terminal domain-containing protein [Serratia marcescens]MDQ9424666.1 DNA circularization N-terminal domain-containing protein [Serratia marc